MKFTEILPLLENHSYVRRKCWSKHVFVQYRHTANLMRTVVIIPGDGIKLIDNDIRLSAEDLFADDWEAIDTMEISY